MNKMLQIGIVIIGLCIFFTSVYDYVGYTDNRKEVEFIFEVQEDGSYTELSKVEIEDQPIKLLFGVLIGLLMIIWALYWYPKKYSDA